MKSTKYIYGLFLVSILAIGLLMGSCKKDDVDNDFTIRYAGITELAPGMSFVSNTPNTYGGKPTDFAITQVKLDDQSIETNSFTIDPETGMISIARTDALEVGIYLVSVSCRMNGRTYVFADVFEVNLMAAVPSSIAAEPDYLEVSYYGDFFDKSITSQIVYTSESVAATNFRIVPAGATASGSPYFTVTAQGVVSIIQDSPTSHVQVPPGRHILGITVVTRAGEVTFEDVLTFNVTSDPIGLYYSAQNGKLIAGSAFRTRAATLTGSTDGVRYEIVGITPMTDQITIDENTGALIAAAGNTLAIGDSYTFDIRVTNIYGERTFFNAWAVDVVDNIIPIANFSYSTGLNPYESVAFTISPDAGLEGEDIEFSFVDLPTELVGKLTLNAATGVISAERNNGIPVGEYPVSVMALNDISDVEDPDIARFTLVIRENPNKFTYIRYGNNIGLTPAADYPNMFRFWSRDDIGTNGYRVTPTTDLAPGTTVTWTQVKKFRLGSYDAASTPSSITIDAQTGELTMGQNLYQASQGGTAGLLVVTATAGAGTDAEYSLSVPVFFNFPAYDATLGYAITYTPFVLCVDPGEGGRSVVPVIQNKDGQKPAAFSLDYRRNFNFYRVADVAQADEGQLNSAGTGAYLERMWDSYYTAAGGSGYGSKSPVSYFETNGTVVTSNLSLKLLYVDNAQTSNRFSVFVNPSKWDRATQGIFYGQMTAVLVDNGVDITANNARQYWPLFIWFDPMFKQQ